MLTMASIVTHATIIFTELERATITGDQFFRVPSENTLFQIVFQQPVDSDPIV